MFYIAADAPWQNGLTERKGGIWKLAANRVIEHENVCGKIGVDTLAVSVNHAKSTMPNPSGFSSAQWVLGKSPPVPASILHDGGNLVVHDQAVNDPTFARRLAIQTAARHAMIECDSSSRLRRALLKRSRPDREPFRQGEQVYFWRRVRSMKKTSHPQQPLGWPRPSARARRTFCCLECLPWCRCTHCS